MMRRTTLGLLILVACGGGKKSLDQADVQAKVGAEAADQVGVAAASTTCPGGLKAAAGTSFSCDVTFQGGGKLTFKVDQTDAAGSLSFSPVGDWLLGDKMETDLITEMFLIGNRDAAVDCGGAVVPITLPGSIQCSVTRGSASAKIEVAVDAQRNVDWKLVGTL